MPKKGANHPPLDLTLPEYERVYQVIYSVLVHVADVPNACIFFSIAGASILALKHKIPARAIAGAAMYHIDDRTSTICTFGEFVDGKLTSESAFHCWVETENFAIDFMAPIFHESMKERGSELQLPRRMFQKRLNHIAPRLDDLKREGDFALQADPIRTAKIVDTFFDTPKSTDLLNVCLSWYSKYPKPLRQVAMTNGPDTPYRLEPRAPRISGAW